LGLLKRGKKEPEEVQLYHIWSTDTLIVTFENTIELNSCWEKNGDTFTAVSDGSSIDALDLGENFESKVIQIPSLLQIDYGMIVEFKEKSTVTIKDGFLTMKKGDVVGSGLSEEEFLSQEKENKHKNWKLLGGIAKNTAIAGGALAAGAYVGYKIAK